MTIATRLVLAGTVGARSCRSGAGDGDLVGFLALAIDLGMLAIAKTQVQQAADLAALDRRTHPERQLDASTTTRPRPRPTRRTS